MKEKIKYLNLKDGEVPSECPLDDELSPHIGYNGHVSLDIYYNNQFQENEELIKMDLDFIKDLDIYLARYAPKHTRLLKATMTGTVYLDDVAIQIFVEDNDRKLIFTDIGGPKNIITHGNIGKFSNSLFANWKTEPINDKIIVSYEYKYGG